MSARPIKRLKLLAFHKLLVAAALALSAVFIAWGVTHGVLRGERQGYALLAMGLVALPVLALYLRKLFRDPPIR